MATTGSRALLPDSDWADELKTALKRNDKHMHSKYVQLATVTKEGLPAVRTVVFRGWVPMKPGSQEGGAGGSAVAAGLADIGAAPAQAAGAASEAADGMQEEVKVDGAALHLKFITDLRSQKMQQSKMAEVCWYFTDTREQFRLSGELIMVTEEEEREALQRQRVGMWKSISENARAQFVWPDPGIERLPDADDEADFKNCETSRDVPAKNFVLVLLKPNKVDRLLLKGFPQKRTVWASEDKEGLQWTRSDVNP